jgi:hypothetical protein
MLIALHEITILQQVLAVLSAVTQQLRPDEQLSFDAIVAELTKPELLHHEHQHVQGLVLDCLRQVVRVCKLDNYTSDHLLSPSSSTNTSPQVSCDNEVYVACGVCLLKSNARWLRSYLSSCAHTFLCCLLFGQRREQDTSSSPQPPKANTPLEKNRAHGKALAVTGKGANRKERRRAQPEMEHWLSAPGELATIIKCVITISAISVL